jgi:peptidoglycan/LPS O-acetylase OafA/YrhL
MWEKYMKKRLTSLDAVRAFACICVLFYHMYLWLWGPLGVSIFFVLSGFLSAYNHLDDMDTEHITLRSSAKMALGKIGKLYPLFLVTLIIPVLFEIYGVVSGLAPVSDLILKTAANVLLLQSWIPLNEYYMSYNAPAWFLSTILFCYLLLPRFLRWVKKCRSARSALIIIIALWVGNIALCKIVEAICSSVTADESKIEEICTWFCKVFPPIRMGGFIIGCFLAKIFIDCGSKEISPLKGTLAELGAIAVTIISQLCFDFMLIGLDEANIFVPASCALVYTFAVNGGSISKLLTGKVTAFISRISSEIFLIHAVVIKACSPIITYLPISSLAQKIIFVITVPTITVAAAIISTKLRAARLSKRRAAKAA